MVASLLNMFLIKEATILNNFIKRLIHTISTTILILIKKKQVIKVRKKTKKIKSMVTVKKPRKIVRVRSSKLIKESLPTIRWKDLERKQTISKNKKEFSQETSKMVREMGKGFWKSGKVQRSNCILETGKMGKSTGKFWGPVNLKVQLFSRVNLSRIKNKLLT